MVYFGWEIHFTAAGPADCDFVLCGADPFRRDPDPAEPVYGGGIAFHRRVCHCLSAQYAHVLF